MYAGGTYTFSVRSGSRPVAVISCSSASLDQQQRSGSQRIPLAVHARPAGARNHEQPLIRPAMPIARAALGSAGREHHLGRLGPRVAAARREIPLPNRSCFLCIVSSVLHERWFGHESMHEAFRAAGSSWSRSMFPIRDDNPHFLTPVVTYALIAANVLAWLLLQGAGTEPALSSSVCRLGLIPAELLQNGAAGRAFPVGPDTRVHRSATRARGSHRCRRCSCTAEWMHLIGNMWFLWLFGNNVEDSMTPGPASSRSTCCAGSVPPSLQVLAEPASSGAHGRRLGRHQRRHGRISRAAIRRRASTPSCLLGFIFYYHRSSCLG